MCQRYSGGHRADTIASARDLSSVFAIHSRLAARGDSTAGARCDQTRIEQNSMVVGTFPLEGCTLTQRRCGDGIVFYPLEVEFPLLGIDQREF